MDTDPRFDDITEFERKGYILFQVAKDTKAGVDNAYFGIEEAPVSSTPRSSRDASKDIDSLTAKDDDNLDLMDEDVVTIGTNKGSSPMVPDLAFNDPEDEDKKEEKPKASTPTPKKEKKTDDDTLDISDDIEDDIDEDHQGLS